jgi:hypothetical protein
MSYIYSLAFHFFQELHEPRVMAKMDKFDGNTAIQRLFGILSTEDAWISCISMYDSS